MSEGAHSSRNSHSENSSRLDVIPCIYCKVSYPIGSIDMHEKHCTRKPKPQPLKPAKIYNSAAARMRGTEMEAFKLAQENAAAKKRKSAAAQAAHARAREAARKAEGTTAKPRPVTAMASLAQRKVAATTCDSTVPIQERPKSNWKEENAALQDAIRQALSLNEDDEFEFFVRVRAPGTSTDNLGNVSVGSSKSEDDLKSLEPAEQNNCRLDVIPCIYCKVQYPIGSIDMHEKHCTRKPKPQLLKATKIYNSAAARMRGTEMEAFKLDQENTAARKRKAAAAQAAHARSREAARKAEGTTAKPRPVTATAILAQRKVATTTCDSSVPRPERPKSNWKEKHAALQDAIRQARSLNSKADKDEFFVHVSAPKTPTNNLGNVFVGSSKSEDDLKNLVPAEQNNAMHHIIS